MFRFGLLWFVFTLVIAGGAAALGYQAGAAGTSVPVWVGLGLGFFGWFPFLLILFLLFGFLFRPWRRGHWKGHHGGHGRPPFEDRMREWHSKEHGEAPKDQSVTV